MNTIHTSPLTSGSEMKSDTDFSSEMRDEVSLNSPTANKLQREATRRFSRKADEQTAELTVERKLSVQLNKINEMCAPTMMTIEEMEKKKEKFESKQIGLGNMDQGIINFIVDDEES